MSDGALIQSFPAGIVNGSLCVTTTALNDDLIENEETYLVSVNSNDSSVIIMNGVAQITIADLNMSEYCTYHSSD